QFNTRLFDRTHNRISLTEAGERVFEYADRIFEIYSEMDSAIREMTGDVSGILMIGASTTIAEYMLPALLGDFKKKYPDVNVQLKVSNSDGIVHMVENNVIDLGVVESPVMNKNLVVEVCRVDKLVAVVAPGHPLAERESVGIDDLLEYPYICREEGSGTRDVIADYMTAQGVGAGQVHLTMELGSPESIKGAVEAGMGLSIISLTTVQKELKLGTLVALKLAPSLERSFSFVHQKQKFRHRAMDELLEFARNYCKSHAEAV
ncbi:Transcriptional regulator, LysR family, partial [hydrothermal vent metagenome]